MPDTGLFCWDIQSFAQVLKRKSRQLIRLSRCAGLIFYHVFPCRSHEFRAFGGLLQAERPLHANGVPRPSWLDEELRTVKTAADTERLCLFRFCILASLGNSPLEFWPSGLDGGTSNIFKSVDSTSTDTKDIRGTEVLFATVKCVVWSRCDLTNSTYCSPHIACLVWCLKEPTCFFLQHVQDYYNLKVQLVWIW